MIEIINISSLLNKYNYILIYNYIYFQKVPNKTRFIQFSIRLFTCDLRPKKKKKKIITGANNTKCARNLKGALTMQTFEDVQLIMFCLK